MIDVREADFDALVLRSPVPVAVAFTSPTCGPCRVLKPMLESVAEVIGDRARIVGVNVADEESLAVRYGISAVPTILLFAPGGREVRRMIGLGELGELRAALEA